MLNIGSAKIQLIMRNLVSNAYTMCATFFSNIVGISGKVRLVSFFRHKNISKISRTWSESGFYTLPRAIFSENSIRTEILFTPCVQRFSQT